MPCSTSSTRCAGSSAWPAPRGQPLEGDGVGAGGVHAAARRARSPRPRRPRARRSSGRRSVRRRPRRRAGPSRCGPGRRRRRRPGCPGARSVVLEVGDGDLVAGLQLVGATGRPRTSSSTPRRTIGSMVCTPSSTYLPPTPASAASRPPCSMPSWETCAKRVDVGADVGAHRDHVVGAPSRRRRGPCRRAGAAACARTPGGWATAACRRVSGRPRSTTSQPGTARLPSSCVAHRTLSALPQGLDLVHGVAELVEHVVGVLAQWRGR